MKYAVLLFSSCTLGISGCSSHKQTSVKEALQPGSLQQTNDTVMAENLTTSDHNAKDNIDSDSYDRNAEDNIDSDSSNQNAEDNIDFNTISDRNDILDQKEQMEELIDLLFTAYFIGDMDTIQQYTDSETNTTLQTYPDKIAADLVPQYNIKGLEEIETIKEGTAYSVWCEFKMHAEDDFYQYLTIGMIKRGSEWKIQSLGLEM